VGAYNSSHPAGFRGASFRREGQRAGKGRGRNGEKKGVNGIVWKKSRQDDGWKRREEKVHQWAPTRMF